MKIRILLQDRLDERGLSQRKLHELTGIRLQTINEYTRELSERISIEHIAKICEALNCGVSDILVLMDDAGEPIELPVLRSDVDALATLQTIAYQIRPLLRDREREKVLVHQ